jgi:hypothetical protein
MCKESHPLSLLDLSNKPLVVCQVKLVGEDMRKTFI